MPPIRVRFAKFSARGRPLFTLALAGALTAQELTLEALAKRRDLWPAECKLTAAVDHTGGRLPAGCACIVLDITGRKLVLMPVDRELGFELDCSRTDFLTSARAAWNAMTPEQRDLDYAKLATRADLWPARVTLVRVQAFKAGDSDKQTVYPRGTEMDFGCFDGERVRLGHAEHDPHATFETSATDLMVRARAAMLEKPRAVGRVLAELDGKLISLKAGKAAKLNLAKPPRFTVLYFGAEASGPCQVFAPKLVEFYDAHRQAGRAFEVVFVSRDASAAEMLRHARKHKFPWLAVSFEKLKSIPIVQAHARYGIPHVLVLDPEGNVLADSYRNGESRGASTALDELGELLEPRKK